MANARLLLNVAGTKLKQASFLWFKGCKEACSLHRVIILCLRSKKLLIRTGQCFLLNGFLFLGSIWLLNSIVIPTLRWILPDQCAEVTSQNQCPLGSLPKFYSPLRLGLSQLFYIFWFYPLIIFSFILSTLWYNDIGKLGFSAMEKKFPKALEPANVNNAIPESFPMEKLPGLGGLMIGIGEQLYSALLLNIFFLEVYAIGYIPYIGKVFNFILLSWMYSYYCFEYKWNLSEIPLDKRLDFFESNWAFFAGFGSPCVVAIFFLPSLVSYGLMAVLFPLFVVTATGSEADDKIFSQKRNWEGIELPRLPIFYVADAIALRILSLLRKTAQ